MIIRSNIGEGYIYCRDINTMVFNQYSEYLLNFCRDIISSVDITGSLQRFFEYLVEERNLIYSPGSRWRHHANRCGLLEHIADMLDCAEYISYKYKCDLFSLIKCIVAHDCSKTIIYKENTISIEKCKYEDWYRYQLIEAFNNVRHELISINMCKEFGLRLSDEEKYAIYPGKFKYFKSQDSLNLRDALLELDKYSVDISKPFYVNVKRYCKSLGITPFNKNLLASNRSEIW